MDAGAADLVALRLVADRYAVAVDRGDAVLFAGQFTDDGVLVAPRGTFAGRDELATVPGMMKGLYRKTFHAVLTQVVEVDGDVAAGETYCIARHWYDAPDDQPFCYEMTVRYQDRFRREGGHWRLARRELVVDATHRFPLEARKTG